MRRPAPERAKSSSGFTVTLTPPNNTIQLAAGAVDVTVVG
jgi:hypothetical protein